MEIVFTITVRVERESGKFVSRDDIAEQLIDVIQDANPGTVEVDESVYNVESIEAEQEEPVKKGKVRA
jgi:hypothetical protein